MAKLMSKSELIQKIAEHAAEKRSAPYHNQSDSQQQTHRDRLDRVHSAERPMWKHHL